MKPDAERKRPQRASLKDGTPFTAEVLRELLQTKALRGRGNMPSDEALKELARILEGWRQHYLVDQNLQPLQREACAAADKLSPALKKLREMNASFHAAAVRDAAPRYVCDILETRLAEINGALQSLAGLNRESITVKYVGGCGLTWKWLADALPEDFCNAMRSTNPGFEARFGYKVALHRFIAAVAPSLTGEHPTPSSVATKQKTRRKRTVKKGKTREETFP
jgi:hypothetical protein